MVLSAKFSAVNGAKAPLELLLLLLALDLLFCFADEELPPFVRPCMVVVSLPPPGTPEFVVELTSDTMCIFSSGFKGWTQTEEGTLALIHLTSLTLVPLMDLPRLHQSQEHQREIRVTGISHNYSQFVIHEKRRRRDHQRIISPSTGEEDVAHLLEIYTSKIPLLFGFLLGLHTR